jgi:hypothetical protein
VEQLILNCLQANQEEYNPDDIHTSSKMEEDCEAFYHTAQGKFGTNEKGFFKLLCVLPPEYVPPLNMMYADKYGYTLFKAIETEMGGQLRDAALFLLGMKLKPYETVAKLIHWYVCFIVYYFLVSFCFCSICFNTGVFMAGGVCTLHISLPLFRRLYI